MKKTFVAVCSFLTIGVFASGANEIPGIDPKIVSAFEKEFSYAQSIKWETKGELTQVIFSINDQMIMAWYNAEAELVTTARNILYNQLPISVIRSLAIEFNDAGIYGIVEYSGAYETFYQLHAETKNKKLLVRADPSGNLRILKKIK